MGGLAEERKWSTPSAIKQAREGRRCIFIQQAFEMADSGIFSENKPSIGQIQRECLPVDDFKCSFRLPRMDFLTSLTSFFFPFFSSTPPLAAPKPETPTRNHNAHTLSLPMRCP